MATAKPKTKPASRAKSSTAKATNKKPTTKPAAKKDADLEELALLDDKPADKSTEAGALITSPDVEHDPANKSKAYEKQKSTIGVEDTDGKTTASKSTTGKKGRTAGTTTRRSRELDLGTLKAFYPNPGKVVAGIDTLPKKVGEKAKNALHNVSRGVAPSVYTVRAVKMMQANSDSKITATDLKAALEADGYKSGTAAAQAQQQMVLLPFLGVATRDKNVLTLKRDHPLTKAILDPAAYAPKEEAKVAEAA